MKKAVLLLENGSLYEGNSIGVNGEKLGNISFYTGVVGYQEIMTMPANAGKIVVMTYPLIGNYGIADKFMESKKSWIEAIIIKENTRITSNWQAEEDFDEFLKKENVLCIEGTDTRALMVEIREKGEQFGIISTKDFDIKSLNQKINQAKNKKLDKLREISVKKINNLNEKSRTSIAILDIGITNSIINQLKSLNCKLTIFPFNTSADKILELSPEKLIISDGPEMDKGLSEVADDVKKLIGKISILGIGTGTQVIAMAMGAKIKKMYLGHHGLNYPILKPNSLKGVITVQNHSCVIDESSIEGKNIDIIWRNINDKTIEGIKSKKNKVLGYQFYPAPPGINGVNPFLEKFVEHTEDRKQRTENRN